MPRARLENGLLEETGLQGSAQMPGKTGQP